MKKWMLLSCILVVFKTISAQPSVGYFPFQSEISISTHTEKIVWGDFRIASNTFFGNITTEPILMLNFKKTNSANYYGGIGMNLNLFNTFNNISIINGFNLHIGTRTKPFKYINNLYVIFEISPYLNRKLDGGLLRTRLGIAYQFQKKNQARSSDSN